MVKLISKFRNRFEVSERRLDFCRACEHYDKTFHKCLKCGCFMEAKTLLMAAECPIGKWGMEEDINNTDVIQEREQWKNS